VASQRVQLVVAVWDRPVVDSRLDQPLRDEIREAPVGRRGVGVILYRQPEVPIGPLTGGLDHVLARAQELDHRERQIGKSRGVRLAAFCEELFEGTGARLRW